MELVFRDYTVVNDGVVLRFRSRKPRREYGIFITDGELNGATTQEAVKEIMRNKLTRLIKACTINPKLSPLVGQSVVI